jgi:hypothetical protein
LRVNLVIAATVKGRLELLLVDRNKGGRDV